MKAPRRRASTAALASALLCAAALTGCAGYRGPGRAVEPGVLRAPGWLPARSTPLLRQRRPDDCGLAAAAMVLHAWHRAGWSAVRAAQPPRRGLRARELRDLLRRHGLRAFVIAGTLTDLEHELGAGRPVVVGTIKRVERRRARRHFEVVVAVHPAQQRIVTLDPAAGWRQFSYRGFLEEWSPSGHTMVVALPGTPGGQHAGWNRRAGAIASGSAR
jgi:hypothetical protein